MVLEAEKLMKEKGGILPGRKWLIDSGYNSLYCRMKEYPEKFKHIKKEGRKWKTPEEWVKVSEQLVKENSGILPNSKWLTNNGYSGLNTCMNKYPELFKHLEQDNKSKTPKEWVKIAEELEKKYGKLPHYKWLTDNDYAGLNTCMKKYPELFKHIKQISKRGKTPKEWLEVAKQLVKGNGGVLQNIRWLIDNGYSGLGKCIEKHPELFKGMKQRYRKKYRGKYINGIRTL